MLEADADHVWSKLSNWAVVYFAARSLRQIFTSAYALAPILIATLRADSLGTGLAVERRHRINSRACVFVRASVRLPMV